MYLLFGDCPRLIVFSFEYVRILDRMFRDLPDYKGIKKIIRFGFVKLSDQVMKKRLFSMNQFVLSFKKFLEKEGQKYELHLFSLRRLELR